MGVGANSVQLSFTGAEL